MDKSLEEVYIKKEGIKGQKVKKIRVRPKAIDREKEPTTNAYKNTNRNSKKVKTLFETVHCGRGKKGQRGGTKWVCNGTE